MSHSNGRIYSETVNGKKIGINTDDVRTVLGSASHDVGTLCRYASIKKFNKNKPYRGTLPTVASRDIATSNANETGDNGTGYYCGARGTTAEYPIYWGMQYPMNTTSQNPSGQSRNTLLEMCYYVATATSTVTYPNYPYMRPVAGIDFARLDDFDGYNINNIDFLEAGVSRAEGRHLQAALLQTNRFENNAITIYARAANQDFDFKDIIPEPSQYYLVAEFYKVDDFKVSEVSKVSSPKPFLTAWSTQNLSQASRTMTFDVLISLIKSRGGYASTSNMNFYVCVGFNKKSGFTDSNGDQTGAYGTAFVAPWSNTRFCATFVITSMVSPYEVFFTQYAGPTGSYANFPSTATSVTYSTMRFKATVYNNSSSTLNIFAGATTAPAGALKFRAKAVGSYGAYANTIDNTEHRANGGDDSNGAWRILEIATAADMSSTVNSVTILAGSNMTLYFRANNLLPYGNTIGIIIEVSNDNGASWATTGTKTAYFNRRT